jgi:hypothetical protein
VTLRAAYVHGSNAAQAHYKLAGPMGADIGVQPKGPEVSHGTASNPYPVQATGTSAARAGMSDVLWDRFTTHDRMAPGSADGSFGSETIS